MTESPESSPEFQRVGSSCGVQGCLFAAVGIFVILLIAMLIVAVFRFSQPPGGRIAPPPETGVEVGVAAPPPAFQQLAPHAPGHAGGREEDHA